MKVGYKCHACGIERWIKVADRGEEEDVFAFVRRVGAAAGKDHHGTSLLCKSVHVDLMLPAGEDGRVGGDPSDAPPPPFAKRGN